MTAQVILLQAAIEGRLQAMSGYLGDANTQFENTVITPVNGQAYQIINHFLAEPQNPEQGGKFFIENGYTQVSLAFPVAVGKGAALDMAQKIRDWFYKGLSLAAGGVTVIINRTPTIAPGAVAGDRYFVPVKIRFTANNAS